MAKTMTLTRIRVGIARAMRRSTYCFMRSRLLLDPREGQAAPEVVPVVVLEAFDVRRMRDVTRRHRHVDVVRFVGQVALDLVDDLATLLRIVLAALGQQHPGQLGIVYVTAVPRRAGQVLRGQEV